MHSSSLIIVVCQTPELIGVMVVHKRRNKTEKVKRDGERRRTDVKVTSDVRGPLELLAGNNKGCSSFIVANSYLR